MMASSVNLGSQLEATVDELVSQGRFGSRSEVLRAGVRLLQEREASLALFNAEIAKGLESARRGDTVPLDEAFDQIKAKIRRYAARRAA